MPWKRTLKFAAPVAYVAALVGSSIAWGLPLSHDIQLVWLLAGLFAFSIGDLRHWARGLIVDWLPLFAVLLVYDLVRGYADGLVSKAHVHPQIDADRFLFHGHVPTVWLQHHLFNAGFPHFWDYIAWTVYTSHFFATIIVAAVLWKIAHRKFARFATMFVVLTLAGYATYVLFPAMPPWLASYNGALPETTRIVPLMWHHVGLDSAASIFERGSHYSNDVAAMPSLHGAYPFLLMLFFSYRGWPTRIFLGCYALAMGLTLMYGAEHYCIDILMGWIYATATFFATNYAFRLIDRRRDERAHRARIQATATANDTTSSSAPSAEDAESATIQL